MDSGVQERILIIQYKRKKNLSENGLCEKSPEKIQTVIKLNRPAVQVLLTHLIKSCSSRNTLNWKPDCSSASSCFLGVATHSSISKHARCPPLVWYIWRTAPLGATSFCNKNQGSKNTVVSLEKEIKSSKPKWVLLSRRTSFGECRPSSCWLQTQEIRWFASMWLLKIRLFLEMRIKVLTSS